MSGSWTIFSAVTPFLTKAIEAYERERLEMRQLLIETRDLLVEIRDELKKLNARESDR